MINAINANERYCVKIGRTPESYLIVALDGGVERLYTERVFDDVVGASNIAKTILSMNAPETEPLMFEGYKGREGVIPANRDFVRAIRAHFIQLQGNIARNRDTQLKIRRKASVNAFAEAV